MIKEFIKRYKHVNWALSDQVVVSGVNFLTGILLARFLGINEYGQFVLMWVVVLFFSSLQMAIINSPMMSIGPKQLKEKRKKYYSGVLVQQLILACFAFIVTYVGVKVSVEFYPEWHIKHLSLPLSFVVFFYLIQDFIRRYFYAQEKNHLAFYNDVISYLGQLIILIYLFVTTNVEIIDVLLVISITSAVAVIVGFFKIETSYCSKEALYYSVMRHRGFAKWMTLSAVLQWMSGNLFLIFSGSLLGASVVGVLKASQNIMAISHVLFQAIENIATVRSSIIYHNYGSQALYKYLKNIVIIGGGATAVIAIVVGLFSDFLLSFVYGEKFIEYGYILRWYAVIYIVHFFVYPLRAGVRAIEAVKFLFIADCIVAGFSLLAAKFLIENYKILGVVSGVLAVNVIMVIILFLYISQRAKDDRKHQH